MAEVEGFLALVSTTERLLRARQGSTMPRWRRVRNLEAHEPRVLFALGIVSRYVLTDEPHWTWPGRGGDRGGR